MQKRMQSRVLVIFIQAVCVCMLAVFIGYISGTERTREAAAADVAEEILTEYTDYAGKMRSATVLELRSLYGLNANDYETLTLYVPQSNMNVDELLIVHMSDISQQAEIREAFEARIETQISRFESYGTDQMGLLNGALCDVYGNYCICIIAENPEEIRSRFRSVLTAEE